MKRKVTMSGGNVWFIDDGRIGNCNQLKSFEFYFLKLGFTCEFVDVEFSSLIKLPNIINLIFNSGIKILRPRKNKPDIIISVGRKSALVSALLKKKYRDVKLIQVMNPNLPYYLFDYIISPKHDNNKEAFAEILLTPSLSNKELLPSEAKKWPEFKKSSDILTVIIGGDTKNKKISVESYKIFLEKILPLKTNKQIYILTSRRTGEKNEAFIKKTVGDNANVITWSEAKLNNPYLALLYYSKNIIVTADSISMISDSVSAEKNTHIYLDGFGEKKQQEFANNLIKEGYANSFNSNLKAVKKKYKNETEEVINKILKTLPQVK
jgi:mitochondrial fission protein ELM1